MFCSALGLGAGPASAGRPRAGNGPAFDGCPAARR